MTNSKDEQGVALVTTLIFLVVMGVLSTALVFTVNNEMMASAAYKYGQQAFFVANAGIYKALDWFRNDPSNPDPMKYIPFMGNNYPVWPPQIGGQLVYLAGANFSKTGANYPIQTVSDAFTSIFSPLNEQSRVEADSTRNFGNFGVDATLLSHRNVTFLNITYDASGNPLLNPVPLPGTVERWRLDSVGFWASVTKPLGTARIVATIENGGEAFFDRALWGKRLVDMGGTSYVDSFDPNKGAWDATTNCDWNGGIGSNFSINASNNSYIYGDAAYGPQGTENLNPASVTGSIIQLSEPRDFPEIVPFDVGTGSDLWKNQTVSAADASGNIIPYGKVTIDGEVTLEPGIYHMDSLLVKSQAKMIITGDTTLYIKDGFSMQGQASGSDPANPKNLTIMYSGTKEIKWAGGTDLSASIFAPYATLTLTGGSDYAGSFIADVVRTIGNARVHFDEGNLNRNLQPRPFRIITWAQSTTLP